MLKLKEELYYDNTASIKFTLSNRSATVEGGGGSGGSLSFVAK